MAYLTPDSSVSSLTKIIMNSFQIFNTTSVAARFHSKGEFLIQIFINELLHFIVGLIITLYPLSQVQLLYYITINLLKVDVGSDSILLSR